MASSGVLANIAAASLPVAVAVGGLEHIWCHTVS